MGDKLHANFAKTNHLRSAAGLVILLVLALAAGCSSDSNSVTGRVTLDSEPLVDAIVQFVPQDGGGRIALGRTDANGEYRLKSSRNITDVSPGKYLVEIRTADLANDNGDGSEKMTPELVPKQFNSNSDVIKEIKAGANIIDFDIPSK